MPKREPVASKSVIGIDSVLDFKMYKEFNARVNAYHARDGIVGTDSTNIASSTSKISKQDGPSTIEENSTEHNNIAPHFAKVRSAVSGSQSKTRHHRRTSSIAPPPVPPRPSAFLIGNMEPHSLNTIDSESKMEPKITVTLNKSSLLGLEQQHFQRKHSQSSDVNFRPLTPISLKTEYTFVDNLKSSSFSLVLAHLASGRDW